jgi:1-acyl-sn-glycerol-3-phosphate acyltransferase
MPETLFNKLISFVGKKSKSTAETEEPFQRSPETIRRWRWLADWTHLYFSPEVLGFSQVPRSGPMLLVGNHSGGVLMSDAYVLMSAWLTQRPEQPLYSLGHDMLFIIPFFADLARAGGVLPARAGNAERALELGHPVLVYPGGDHDIFRPTHERNRIDFGGRQGFVRLALKRQVPLVPVVSYGGHDTNLFLTRGEGLAKALGLHKVRVRGVPLVIGLPWGLAPGFMPTIPLPVKITLEFLPALRWPELGPEAAADPVVVKRCYDEVQAIMQAGMDRLAAERPNPFSRKRHPRR